MLEYLPENKGFCTDLIVYNDKKLRVGLIDADLLDHGTRHPNLALLKISAYCKEYGHNVRLICSYDELLNSDIQEIIECDYDLLVLSRVFKFTKIPPFIEELIKDHYIFYGGTGFFEVNGPNLPHEVEHHKPDYLLYEEYINIATGGDAEKKKHDWDDYLSYSIGFTTRGCIRHCGFCVNRELNRVLRWSPVSEFLDPSRKSIYLWDDNIMAAPASVFRDVMRDLISTNKPFQFRQGMDIRLMTDEKAELLANVKYHGDYIFAFDHYRLDNLKEKKEVEQTIKGLGIWRKHCLKSTKLYVLVGYDGQDVQDIKGTFFRIKILMEFGCLPYIMRFEKSYEAEPIYKDMYTQIARWCNQPSFFKKKSFREYCIANEEYRINKLKETEEKMKKEGKKQRKLKSKLEFGSSLRTLIEFENKHPDVAEEYFDMRFDQLNRFEI